ncbi:ABC transporter ATP-binding protein [Hazenella sp. IB182357]|uniref:ABC transporter ATP-binding protein n=1 Tax=Polycladospora coralii TaxID=2771432 RepID=A0A926N8I9_9BACL|nr:ABC transporter ATP-binding protein [Polycladospora coralii]MBD1372096.1 ABC transporter ATP-binding protein [Polycladospora coralii]MBS7530602.1 ABC transporter ATP-binding protein [Polycladospora coralii]
MVEPIVQIKNLKKSIGGHEVIKGLNFDVYPGEVLGFLGPNGAGKTTTIRMMVGLISITEGDILIGGHSIKKNFQKAIANIGGIVENPDLYKYLTGWQNLMQYARMVTGVDQERLHHIVKLIGLENAIHKKVKTYSLGMKQRLGLAQALLHNPSVLILDEPTNGLDPAGIQELRDYLRKLAHEENVAVLVSSHLLSEMEMMCDRIAIIQKGELIKIELITELVADKVHFEVSPLEKAQKVLENQFADLDCVIEKHELIVSASKEQIAEISKVFIQEEIQLYGIRKQELSLEQHFLEVTNQKKIG